MKPKRMTVLTGIVALILIVSTILPVSATMPGYLPNVELSGPKVVLGEDPVHMSIQGLGKDTRIDLSIELETRDPSSADQQFVIENAQMPFGLCDAGITFTVHGRNVDAIKFEDENMDDPAEPARFVQKTGAGTIDFIVDGTQCACGGNHRMGLEYTASNPAQQSVIGMKWVGKTASSTGSADILFDIDGTTEGKATVTLKVDDRQVLKRTVQLVKSVPQGIRIASPNGAETWDQGSEQTIAWTYAGNVGNSVRIVLLKDDATVATIAQHAPIGTGGTGSYRWSIPKNLAAGGDYRIGIVSVSKPSIRDTSDGYFAIGTMQNRPPNILPIPYRVVRAGITSTFTVSASDPDGDTLRFYAFGLPAGAKFDSSTGTVTWRPNFFQTGNYRITIVASDGTLRDSEVMKITVVRR